MIVSAACTDSIGRDNVLPINLIDICTKVQLDRLHNKDVLHRKWVWPCRSRDIYRFKGVTAVL